MRTRPPTTAMKPEVESLLSNVRTLSRSAALQPTSSGRSTRAQSSVGYTARDAVDSVPGRGADAHVVALANSTATATNPNTRCASIRWNWWTLMIRYPNRTTSECQDGERKPGRRERRGRDNALLRSLVLLRPLPATTIAAGRSSGIIRSLRHTLRDQ